MNCTECGRELTLAGMFTHDERGLSGACANRLRDRVTFIRAASKLGDRCSEEIELAARGVYVGDTVEEAMRKATMGKQVTWKAERGEELTTSHRRTRASNQPDPTNREYLDQLSQHTIRLTTLSTQPHTPQSPTPFDPDRR